MQHLRKLPGVWGFFPFRDASRLLDLRTFRSAYLHTCLRTILFCFRCLRTLLHLPETQLLSFQAFAHSLRKTTRGRGTPCFTEAQYEVHRHQHEPAPQPALPLSLPQVADHGTRVTLPPVAAFPSGCYDLVFHDPC